MTHFAVHTSDGLSFTDGFPSVGTNTSTFETFEGKVKTFTFSNNGEKIAWIADGQVHVAVAPDWTKVGSLKHPRAQEVFFSPKGSYLAIWDAYVKTVDQSQVQPNLNIYDVCEKKLLKSFFQQTQTNWQPQWTGDESVLARNVTNEVHFYQANDLQNIVEKKVLPKVRSFSLSPSEKNHHVTFFVPSVKAAPAFVHLYKYPNFKDASSALANKSFFKVDSVENYWNKQCTACLMLTAAEVDKSGGSYYGDNSLYYLSTRGDSARLTFSKQGNIHSVAWCPNGQEFFVVYGTMPSKATLFNHKCDAVAEFGAGARNTVLVNPVGNIVLLGGFGNISARFEMWDIKGAKKVSETECADTTHLSWSPCGQYLLTSTCTPRLRVNNGYKLWHYTAVLQHENLIKELYAATWMPDEEAAKPFTISTKAVAGIESNVAAASKQKYVPPSQRGAGPVGMANTEKKFLSQVGSSSVDDASPKLSKAAGKNKKKKEAKKRREELGDREKDKDMDEVKVAAAGAESAKADPSFTTASVQLTGDPEKDKKIRNLKKKIDAIAKLKLEKENGKNLEKTQLEKIATEDRLIKELEDLVV